MTGDESNAIWPFEKHNTHKSNGEWQIEKLTVEVTKKVRELKELTDLPICVGFGIKDGETAKKIAPYADGIVVGSAFVDLVAKGGSPNEISARLKEKALELRASIDAATAS